MKTVILTRIYTNNLRNGKAKLLHSPTSAGHAELCSGMCTTIQHGLILRNEIAHRN